MKSLAVRRHGGLLYGTNFSIGVQKLFRLTADLAKLAVAEMLKRRILINCTSDTVLRFLPPYILKREHVDTAIAALDEILTKHAAHAAAPSAGGHQHG